MTVLKGHQRNYSSPVGIPPFVEKGMASVGKESIFATLKLNHLLLMETMSRVANAVPSNFRKISPEEQVLIDYISSFARLSKMEIDTMLDLVTIKTYPKGTILLREGQLERNCHFVLKGCIRQYYLVDGEEKTTAFFTEGQPVLVSGTPFNDTISKSYLACVEDCTVIEGGPEGEAEFMAQLPRFEMINRVGLESELKKSQETLADYILTSPEERYLKLLKNRPDLIDRVPQYQLASYLGVTPESLSRIRKRIMVK